ncbi:hypothetical protein [Nonomuraea sp. NPDC023979]|uniref:hypothetical protein n=1 Tax=Nonomuraea sp. NPDC023979 TaxID=3154796 RepID=UPI003411C5C5
MALTVPLERIEGKARQLDVRKGLLAVARLLATVLVGIPYVAAWSLSKLWLGVTMLWAAAVTGWRDARRPRAEGGSGT